MAAAIILLLGVDTFVTGVLLRHVFSLQNVISNVAEQVESLSDVCQVTEHDLDEHIRHHHGDE